MNTFKEELVIDFIKQCLIGNWYTFWCTSSSLIPIHNLLLKIFNQHISSDKRNIISSFIHFYISIWWYAEYPLVQYSSLKPRYSKQWWRIVSDMYLIPIRVWDIRLKTCTGEVSVNFYFIILKKDNRYVSDTARILLLYGVKILNNIVHFYI
jgi:hypothetical protein